MKFVCVCFVTAAAQNNPPTWPSTVRVFGSEDSDIEQVVNAAFQTNGGFVPENNGQFSEDRYAFLFKPGTYNVDVPIGYYTQVAGLGKNPSDVKFISENGVFSDEGSHSLQGGALDTFWRSAENFETSAKTMVWAVSQASPLRRVIVNKNLNLFTVKSGPPSNPYYGADYASGGYMGNSRVVGKVESASQQQWMMRNADVGTWDGGVWNMVFVGTKGAPAFHCGNEAAAKGKGHYGSGNKLNPHVTVESTPTIAEKPFISISESGLYSLNIPQVKQGRVGVDFDAGVEVGFDQVYVADALSDTATTINEALTRGLHVVLSPGIYSLDSSLEINQEGQVILGLGLATLIAAKGQPAIKVGDVDGARVAGVLLQAGHEKTDALLQWGSGTYPGNAANPGLIHDVFARVGGPAAATDTQVDVMLQINSGNVIGDNMWLWRADHVEGGGLVRDGQNPCLNGLVVNGDDVTMYSLAAEHTLQDLVKWNGERGAVYFYQSEMPYDVTQDYGNQGYAGYRVAEGVTSHLAYGVGVYHFFRDFEVNVTSGIVAPRALESSFVAPLGVYLNGNGTILHVINDKGATTARESASQVEWVCPGDPTPTSDPYPIPTRGMSTTLPPSPTPSPSTIGMTTTLPPSPASTTPSPAPHGSCNVNESVQCSSGVGYCRGNQCCQDGNICPSAENSFKSCPIKTKAYDCTTAMFVVV